jgi:hypothetical protein
MATPPDFTTGQVLTAAQMNAVGMWLVKTSTVTTQSELICDDAFSADFTNYRIVYTITATSNFIRFQLRSGASNVATNYGNTASTIRDNSTSVGFLNSNAANFNETKWLLGTSDATFGAADIYQPNLAANTFYDAHSSTINTTNASRFTAAGRHNANTVCTGLRIFPDTGTLTGTVRVYGYNE